MGVFLAFADRLTTAGFSEVAASHKKPLAPFFSMARLRRQRSRLLDKARLRAAMLANLDPNLDFEAVSVRLLKEQIVRAQEALEHYNRLIAETDAAKHIFEREEAAANDLAVRLLLAVRSRHGKYSMQYQAAGGRPPPARRKRRKPAIKD